MERSSPRVALSFAIVAMVSGCASGPAVLNVTSEPPGAYVTQAGGTPVGITPANIQYDPGKLEASRQNDGCFVVDGLTARWVSGATVKTTPIRLCDAPSTGQFSYVITRNPNDPGMDQDMKFAVQVQAVSAQRAQAAAAQKQADMDLMQAYQAEKPVTCDSQRAGSEIVTNCQAQ